MKTQYRNLLWLAALPLAFAMGACQNEDIVEAGQSANVEGQIVLRATMGSYNAPQSRAQVELGNEDESQEVFMWNAEDAFTVYDTETQCGIDVHRRRRDKRRNGSCSYLSGARSKFDKW